MATIISVSDLAKLPDLQAPVITLNLNLRKLSFDQSEQLRVKNMLKKIQKEIGAGIEPFISDVNDLTREQLPYEGMTVIADHLGKNVYHLIRTSVDEADYRIEDAIDFLLLLSEAPNMDYTLIELNRDNSKLYKLANKRVTPLEVKDYPTTVKEALGDELRGGELNFSARGGNAQYHGHNETTQEKKIDQERYYRVLMDFLKNNQELSGHQFVLMGLSQNINLFKKINNGLHLANFEVDQSVQNDTPTEIATLVNTAIETSNRQNTAEAITQTFKDQLFTDFKNIENLLNSKDIRHLFVASRNEIKAADPKVYTEINQMIKQALAQDTSVTVVNDDPSVPLVSAV
ncbi:baeRF6 domain-containing protein [Lentilactobacillus otakiensis]|uniref:baeRF6 domain-containing protein n=1 Tax=Lentilactobacillus otakiensis TaxID=481720 RepID=UPI003D17AE12